MNYSIKDIEFICASHRSDVLENNLLKSDIIKKTNCYIKHGFTNIPEAYNSIQLIKAIAIYIHEDVYLPPTFEEDLIIQLQLLPNDWDVAGVAGVYAKPKQNVGCIQDRGKEWGKEFSSPVKVETLDELLLITKGDIEFDEQFPLDFYGADICMNRNAYAICCYVHHNSTRKIGERTESFYKSQELFRKKWEHKLPIITTSAYVQ